MHGAYCTDIRHRHRGGMSNKTPPPTELQIPATVTTLNLTQQKHVFTNQNECTTTQNKPKNLKPGLVAFYDIQLGNREGLFWFWCFIHLSLTYLPIYSPGTHMGLHIEEACSQIQSCCTTCTRDNPVTDSCTPVIALLHTALLLLAFTSHIQVNSQF